MACNFMEKDAGTGVFLWIFLNFKEHLLYRTRPDDCFCNYFDREIKVDNNNNKGNSW